MQRFCNGAATDIRAIVRSVAYRAQQGKIPASRFPPTSLCPKRIIRFTKQGTADHWISRNTEVRLRSLTPSPASV